MAVNKLIREAHFSARSAREQRTRMRLRGEKLIGEPSDVRDTTRVWDRAAEGFRKHDPDGRKLAKLLSKPLS